MIWLEWLWGLPLAGAAFTWLHIGTVLVLTGRRAPVLGSEAIAPPPGRRLPKVSVIVPARNEAPHLATALASLFAQQESLGEVIAIDDRSQDGTGAILERLAEQHAALRVLHVESLPAGWLGKNHANHLGAQVARGDYLLFTDADVVFAPGALRSALAYAEHHDLGHLVVAPRLIAPGFLERAFQSTFVIFFCLKFRLWQIRRPRSAGYAGMGAFNLVRRADYQRVGGHRRLAMEVVDDVKLGLILRRSGVRQGLADSGGLVSVRWQAGFLATLRGLLKNAFAGAEWRWSQVLAGVVSIAWIAVFPWAALLWAPNTPLRLLALAPILTAITVHAGTARRLARGSGWEGLAYPLTHLAMIAVVLLSATLATARNGIVWRDTRYPLAALRAGCVREADWPVAGAVGWK